MTASADRARDALASVQPVLDRLLHEADAGGLLDASQAWDAVARVLRTLAPDASDGDPKALVSALRYQGLCTLDEAHALIDLAALAERGGGAAGELPRRLVVQARELLERIVHTVDDGAAAAPLQAEYRRAAAPPPRSAIPEPAAWKAEAIARDAGMRDAGGAASSLPPLAIPSGGGSGRSSAFVIGLVVVCLLAAGVAAVLFSGVTRRDALADGVAAYQAGQRVAARIAFERALTDDPSDARPLIYLGRLSREEGDLSTARRLLEQAVQRAPEQALAHRELASALLADGQPELARRFYVRALTLDPDDRLAQGFLGCALARLGRTDEARRWFERAGPGDWTACASATLPPRPPGMP